MCSVPRGYFQGSCRDFCKMDFRWSGTVLSSKTKANRMVIEWSGQKRLHEEHLHVDWIGTLAMTWRTDFKGAELSAPTICLVAMLYSMSVQFSSGLGVPARGCRIWSRRRCSAALNSQFNSKHALPKPFAVKKRSVGALLALVKLMQTPILRSSVAKQSNKSSQNILDILGSRRVAVVAGDVVELPLCGDTTWPSG